MQLQSVSLALIAGVLNTVSQIRFPHSVGKVIVVHGLDDDIGDFSSVGVFCREETMPAIDDFVVLVYFNRGKPVKDVSVLLRSGRRRDHRGAGPGPAGARRRRGRSVVGCPYCDCRMIERKRQTAIEPVECLFYRLMLTT